VGLGLSTGAYPELWGDWPAALAAAERFGTEAVELAALRTEELVGLLAFLPAARLDRFHYVSVHAPLTDDGLFLLERLPKRIETIVVHPGLAVDAGFGGRIALENMDVGKETGRTVEELEPFFAKLPEAGFCLDAAHVWTVDLSLEAGHRLLDAFGGRLRQVHVSGIEPGGTHRTTTRTDLARYESLLERCRHVPWILETPLLE
jgi:sugar phosphate isomerase/epimerase